MDIDSTQGCTGLNHKQRAVEDLSVLEKFTTQGIYNSAKILSQRTMIKFLQTVHFL